MAITLGCSCNTGRGNTGKPACMSLMKVTSGFAFMNVVSDAGALNQIDINVAALTTEFSSLITQADKSKRLYPVNDLRNVLFPKEEDVFETDNTGQKSFVRQGVYSVTSEAWEISPVYPSKLKQGCGRRTQVFAFNKEGVTGVKNSSGFWKGIEIKAFQANFMFPDGTQSPKMMMSFDFDQDFYAAELWTIKWADLGITYEDFVGLVDANFEEVTAASTGGGNTTIGLRLTNDYGEGLLNSQNIPGLVTADFAVTANGVPVAGLTVTEVIDDKYTISYTSETPGDAMVVSLVLTSGFEGSYSYVEPA